MIFRALVLGAADLVADRARLSELRVDARKGLTSGNVSRNSHFGCMLSDDAIGLWQQT